MSNKLKTLFSLMLVLCVGATITGSVSARENDGSAIMTTEQDAECEYDESSQHNSGNGRVVTLPGQIGDGTVDTKAELFTMTANHVTELLGTRWTDKSFTVNSLSSVAKKIICEGTLNHSLNGVEGMGFRLDEMIKFGVCYWDYIPEEGEDGYIPECIVSVDIEDIGKLVTETFLIEGNLVENRTYYAYIKNSYPSGYVYGTVTIYWSI